MISDDQAISIEVRGKGGDADRPKAENLGLIVAELVINSLKHAFRNVDKGGQIVVTCDAAETEWTLSVSDNGQGKQKQAKVTEGGTRYRYRRGPRPPAERAGCDREWPARHLRFNCS